MDISLLDREQLKDLIRANDWDDKPSLKSSESELEAYLQGKINSGDLVLSVQEENENGDVALTEAIESAAKEIEKEADPEVMEKPEAEESNQERIVKVALLKPAFIEAGVKTMPTFDEDGIATTIVEVPLSVAKLWQKVGACHING